jgi:hypothetical protein
MGFLIKEKLTSSLYLIPFREDQRGVRTPTSLRVTFRWRIKQLLISKGEYNEL